MNNKLNPYIIARVALRQISLITGNSKYNCNPIFGGIIGGVSYDGIIVNIRSYKNDDNFYFDFKKNQMEFTLTLPMFDKIWEMTIDDFAENIMQQKINEKLDYYGYATWD